MDSSFVYLINQPTNFVAAVGHLGDSGVPVGGNAYYVKTSDASGSASYYELVFIRPATTAALITGVSDTTTPANIVSAKETLNGVAKTTFVQSAVASFDNLTTADIAATVPLIKVVLASTQTGTTSTPLLIASIAVTGTITSMVDSTTPATNYATTGISSGETANVIVTAEDGSTTAAYQIQVVKQSSETGLTTLVTGVRAGATPAALIAPMGVYGAKTGSTDLTKPTLVNYNYAAGTYTISNAASALFTLVNTDSTLALWTDGFNGSAPLSNIFSATLSAGQTYTIYAKVTATDGSFGYYKFAFVDSTANSIYAVGASLATATGATLPAVGGSTKTSPTVINFTVPGTVGSITITSDLLVGTGTLTWYDDSNFSSATVTPATLTFDATTSTFTKYIKSVDIGTGGSTTYFKVTFTRTTATTVSAKVLDGATIGATIRDVNGAIVAKDSSIIGGTSSAAPAVVYVIYAAENNLTDGITAALQFNSGLNPVTASYDKTNTFVPAGKTVVVNATATAESGAKSYFQINFHVKDATNADLVGILGATTTDSLVGTTDKAFITSSIVHFTVPATATTISESSILNIDGYTSTLLYTDAACTNEIGTAGEAIGAKTATLSNSTTLYAAIINGTTPTTTKFYTLVFNKVDTATKYTTATSDFVKIGTNEVANVTVDRVAATKLAAPKLFVIYTLADGITMIYQTLDLTVSDTTATTKIVCSATGIKSIQAFVVDGTVDWSLGTPIKKSNGFIDLVVPVN
jgi:hypothetical protein